MTSFFQGNSIHQIVHIPSRYDENLYFDSVADPDPTRLRYSLLILSNHNSYAFSYVIDTSNDTQNLSTKIPILNNIIYREK